MASWKIATAALASLLAPALVWLAAATPTAAAQDDVEPIVAAESEARPPTVLKCRVFETAVNSGQAFETADGTTEVGQWINAEEGWVLHSVDFEVTQKHTGFPIGFNQICLRPSSP